MAGYRAVTDVTEGEAITAAWGSYFRIADKMRPLADLDRAKTLCGMYFVDANHSLHWADWSSRDDEWLFDRDDRFDEDDAIGWLPT